MYPPTMSLYRTLTQYWPLHTRNSLSSLDVGVTILATSFVSYRRYMCLEATGFLIISSRR